MYDPVPVGVVQSIGHTDRDPNCLLHLELSIPVQFLAKVLTLHKWHDVKEETIGFPRIKEREDVGVRKVCCCLDLGQEPFRAHHGGQFWVQDLHSDLAVVLQVLGQVDDGHSTTANLPLDLIAVSECRLQAFLVLHRVL